MENKFVSSRNRNKNKNKNLQSRARERELNKKQKKQNIDILKIDEKLNVDQMEVKDIVVKAPIRDNIIVVPDRKVVVNDDVDVYEDDDPNFVSINVEKFRFVESDADEFNDKFRFEEDKFDVPAIESDVLPCDDICENIVAEDQSEVSIEEAEQIFNVETNSHEFEEVVLDEAPKLNREEYEVIVENDEIIPKPTKNVNMNAKRYFSFENRIILWLVFIVVSFFIAGVFAFKAITYSTDNAILYDEKSDVEYKVCIDDTNSQYYSEECLTGDINEAYLSDITETVPVKFNYEMQFNNDVSTKVTYYVVSRVNIYNGIQGKLLNTTEEFLFERTEFEIFNHKADFSISVDLPFKKYREFVKNYSNQYNIDGYAEVEVIFYIDNGNVIKKAAVVNLPVSTQTFTVNTREIDNAKQNLTVDSDGWSGINASYGAVGVIFVLFGMLGIIRLSSLVFKVMGSTSMYQRKLDKILKEYDKYIVISNSDYNLDGSKRLIKVASFGELLDARNTLEKPIIYVKVNSVKSEFYVEDSEAIYKYTLKEADLDD